MMDESCSSIDDAFFKFQPIYIIFLASMCLIVSIENQAHLSIIVVQ